MPLSPGMHHSPWQKPETKKKTEAIKKRKQKGHSQRHGFTIAMVLCCFCCFLFSHVHALSNIHKIEIKPVVKLKKKKTKTHHVTCDSRVRQVKLESCSDGRMVPGALSLTAVVHLMFLNGENWVYLTVCLLANCCYTSLWLIAHVPLLLCLSRWLQSSELKPNSSKAFLSRSFHFLHWF